MQRSVRKRASSFIGPASVLLAALTVGASLPACDDDASGRPDAGADDGGGGRAPPVEPVRATAGAHTYRLSESPPELPLFTAPVARRIRLEDRAPDTDASGLTLSAARRELEPVQLVIGPAAGSVRVAVAPFPNLGAGQRIDVARADFVEGWADRLAPVGPTDDVPLSAEHGVPIWLTVRVPEDAPAGDHETTLTVTWAGGDPVAVPVRLAVFDFALPPEIHFASQLNISVADLIPPGGDVDAAKTLLFEHRFTPKSVLWPSGFNSDITWDTPRSPHRCAALWDEPDEPDEHSVGHLARRYILGEGWNGIGFPNALLFQFVDNSTPRPDSFCGEARGDAYGTAAYNAGWSRYLAALGDYLAENGLLERGYYYVQNEPQGPEDYALAAHLCRLTRAAAPGLRIAISEEPKPEIAEDAGGPCGWDIWIAHLPALEPDYAWRRQRDHGETVWFYSLDQDADPYPNPTRLDRPGMDQRILPWIAWALRVRGWAYYDFGRFFDGPRPTVRAELLREGFEDYEYLWLANGGAHPRPFEEARADPTALSVASSATNWTRDPGALMTLREALGHYIEGSRETLPVLTVDAPGRPRAAYNLNFQDPAGPPLDDPLVVDGGTYLKIGWDPWDDALGYGWSGENVGDPAIALYGYDDREDYSVLERSYLYDDYGRRGRFELALANGRYAVTLGVGRPARGYPGDPQNVSVEGRVVVDDEPTSDARPTLSRTVTVDLRDGRLSIEIGGRSATTGDFAYTFLAFVRIVPVD